MPSTVERDELHGERFGSVLFWAGVGVAPLAVVLLLSASVDGRLRAAVGVLAISVLLIGLSMTMRRDGETLRIELEDMVFDEIDAARENARDDIATAAHATHRAFGEKLQYLLEQLQATQAELDATRDQLEALRAESLEMSHAQPARYGANPVGAGWRGTAEPDGRHRPASARSGPGMVRHTETVQVTRRTVVDPHSERASRDGGYPRVPVTGYDRGPRHDVDDYLTTQAGQHRAPEAEREEPWAEREEPWAERRMRVPQLRRVEQPEPSWTGYSTPGVHDSSWSQLSGGDRWAAMRDDAHGRELRIGQRRMAAHCGDSGAELRIEDRWAAVRQEPSHSGYSWREGYGDPLDSGYSWQASERDERPAITASDQERRWSSYLSDHYDEPDRRHRYR